MIHQAQQQRWAGVSSTSSNHVVPLMRRTSIRTPTRAQLGSLAIAAGASSVASPCARPSKLDARRITRGVRVAGAGNGNGATAGAEGLPPPITAV
jgi:hypothetical protein